MDDSVEALGAAVREIRDRQAIEGLVAVYCVAIDDKDWDLLPTLYADDASLGDVVGRDAVVDAIRSVRETYGRTVHSPHSVLIRLESDQRARGLVTSHAELDIAGELVVCHIRYYDSYVKERGDWKFLRRDLKFLYAMPWAQLGESLRHDRPVQWPGADPAPSDEFERWS